MLMDTVNELQARARLKMAIRDFFAASHYLEVDTPIAVPTPGTEVHLRYFKTAWVDHGGQSHPLFLRSSPEIHMKKLLAAGADRIFQLAPCFRNWGETSDWHRPEFTMLEWYEKGLSFTALIDQTEALIRSCNNVMGGYLKLPTQIERISVFEAFERWVGIKLIDQDEDLAAKGIACGAISLRDDDDFETAFFKLLLERVEPGLSELGASVLYDYPESQAALATVRQGVAKRFEIYIGRVELCNGFEELLDPDANAARIRDSHRRRSELGYEVPVEDESFYEALRKGIPPCSGNALGFDRLLALLLGQDKLVGS